MWFSEAFIPPTPPDFVEVAKQLGQYQEDLEQIHGAPIGWFSTNRNNPSSLQAHKFLDGDWIPLPYFKHVRWPEKFPFKGPFITR